MFHARTYCLSLPAVTGGSRCSGILTNGGVVDNGDGTATVTWEPQQILPDLFSCGNDMHLPFVNC